MDLIIELYLYILYILHVRLSLISLWISFDDRIFYTLLYFYTDVYKSFPFVYISIFFCRIHQFVQISWLYVYSTLPFYMLRNFQNAQNVRVTVKGVIIK